MDYHNHTGQLSITFRNMVGVMILIDFSLTVKAATLIFISGRASAFSSAKEGTHILYIIW